MSERWSMRSRLARHSELRPSPEVLGEWFAATGTRLLTIDPDSSRFAVNSTDGRAYDPGNDIFLGREVGDGTAWFAQSGELANGQSARDAGLSPVLREVVTVGLAIVQWHATSGFCERCGASSTPSNGWFERICSRCGRQIYPRTDPAMICAVLDERDRLLLGHQVSWPTGRCSLLAGFVEAGESAEQAVIREVGEESGVQLSAVRYLASQPWPFPRSLMMGFVARGSGEPVVDGIELGWAQWVSREELAEGLASGEWAVPSSVSIAGRIIARWRAGELPSPD